MKKAFGILMCLALLVVLAGCGEKKEENKIGQNQEYEYTILDNGTVKLERYKGDDVELTVPTQLGGATVSTIGSSCFTSSLKSVTIPDSIEFLEGNPFRGCEKLKEVVISQDHPYLALIDGVLFTKADKCLHSYPCSYNVDDYSIPNGTRKIAAYAFTFTQLKRIVIPESVEEIEDNPFWNCKELSQISVVPENQVFEVIDDALLNKKDKIYIWSPRTFVSHIPDGTRVIGQLAFADNHKLVSVSIPDSVVEIKSSAFSNCFDLEKVIIPDSVVSIERNAFFQCKRLEEVVLPKGIKVITQAMFGWCSRLKDITLPEGITLIGEAAFSHCERLSHINIPQSVTQIGRSAFEKTSITSLIIPEGVKSIENSTFYECEKLNSISIPSSVTQIGKLTFYKCEALNDVVLPDSIETIDDDAFYGCENLVSINLPKSIVSIGEKAFEKCQILTATVDKDSYAMKYCADNGIKYVFPDSNDWLSN